MLFLVTMAVPPVLCTREVLLEHLYAVISPMTPGYAEKIVGMLAESTDEDLMNILGDRALLRKRVNDALDCLKSVSLSVSPDVHESLGDELFHRVAEIEPNLCAQVTGMLLELSEADVRKLLTDAVALEKAVCRALAEFTTHHSRRSELPSELADRLYEAVSELYNQNAPKITGMLAEQPQENLEQLLSDPKQFQESVQKCRVSLEDTNQWVTE